MTSANKCKECRKGDGRKSSSYKAWAKCCCHPFLRSAGGSTASRTRIVTHHQRVSFIEFVLRDDSMPDIIEGMDMIDLHGVIETKCWILGFK